MSYDFRLLPIDSFLLQHPVFLFQHLNLYLLKKNLHEQQDPALCLSPLWPVESQVKHHRKMWPLWMSPAPQPGAQQWHQPLPLSWCTTMASAHPNPGAQQWQQRRSLTFVAKSLVADFLPRQQDEFCCEAAGGKWQLSCFSVSHSMNSVTQFKGPNAAVQCQRLTNRKRTNMEGKDFAEKRRWGLYCCKKHDSDMAYVDLPESASQNDPSVVGFQVLVAACELSAPVGKQECWTASASVDSGSTWLLGGHIIEHRSLCLWWKQNW